MRYRDAGVDVTRADGLKASLGAAVRSTWGPGVRPLEGGFAGFIEWPGGGDQLLAATMDGVGTKLHLALAAGRVADAAADLVRHCGNDLLAHGARPLAFLDYVAQERLDPAVVQAVVRGLADACREVGAALLGGETAEMPDTYREGVVDVAGCMIGWAARDAVLDGRAVQGGDVVLGLAAAGLHTNGYALARRVLAGSGLGLAAPLPEGGGVTIGSALLAPHRWYGPALRPALERGYVRALAHVTGGGIAGNLVRVLPDGARAELDPAAWPRPALFRWLMSAGGIPEEDARTAFNLGLGMLIVVAPERRAVLEQELALAGEEVHAVGRIASGPRDVVWLDP